MTVADRADTTTNLAEVIALVQPGMTIQVEAQNFFVSYKDADDNLYISPSPTGSDIVAAYPYVGGAMPASGLIDDGTLKVFSGRIQQTIYTGTVTVPIVATDAAPGDDGNDLSTAQISFALDDIGTPSYTFPS